MEVIIVFCEARMGSYGRDWGQRVCLPRVVNRFCGMDDGGWEEEILPEMRESLPIVKTMGNLGQPSVVPWIFP